MVQFMSDKFKKHLPPGKGTGNGKPKPAGFTQPGFMSPAPKGGGTIKLDKREMDGTFNNARPKAAPAKPAPPARNGFFKPGVPSGQMPKGKPNPAKTGGTIKIDRREMNGTFNNAAPKKGVSGSPMKKPGVQKFAPARQPANKAAKGAHQEFIKRAKEQGIGEKEITRFLAKKIKPKSRK